MEFVVPSDHRVELKECGKRDKYLELAWELTKQWNMKMTEVPVVIGALGKITNGLLPELEGLEIMGLGGDCPNFNVVEIGQNNEKRLEET